MRDRRPSRRCAAHALRAALALLALAGPAARAQGKGAALLPGITFTIDSGPSVPERPEIVRQFGAPPSLITQLGGRIVFAAGRGRLDVTAVAHHPVIRTQGIVLAAPLAAAGDFYLFDSAGFVLVRPATRTFSVFHIADDTYNVEGRRDGWPAWFPLKRTSLDTLGADAPAALRRQHGAWPVYWHADLPGRHLARGRFTIVDARPGELAVVRWFAPTRALAELVLHGDTVARGTPTLTALGLWAEADDTVPPTAVIDVRPFANLKRMDVPRERLLLPADFVEAPWPGYEKVQQVFPTSADSGARWKSLPR